MLLLAGSPMPGPVHGLRAIVDLGASPVLRAVDAPNTTGFVTFQTAEANCSSGHLGRVLFVIGYVAAASGAVPIKTERDDGLWPTPFACAG